MGYSLISNPTHTWDIPKGALTISTKTEIPDEQLLQGAMWLWLSNSDPSRVITLIEGGYARTLLGAENVAQRLVEGGFLIRTPEGHSVTQKLIQAFRPGDIYRRLDDIIKMHLSFWIHQQKGDAWDGHIYDGWRLRAAFKDMPVETAENGEATLRETVTALLRLHQAVTGCGRELPETWSSDHTTYISVHLAMHPVKMGEELIENLLSISQHNSWSTSSMIAWLKSLQPGTDQYAQVLQAMNWFRSRCGDRHIDRIGIEVGMTIAHHNVIEALESYG